MTVTGVGSVASSVGASFGASAIAPVCSTIVAPELATLSSSVGFVAASSLGSSNVFGSYISTIIIAIAILISILSLISVSRRF